MSGLRRRLDRIDGGVWRHRDVDNMADGQLWSIISAPQPDPAGYLAQIRQMDSDSIDSILRSIADCRNAAPIAHVR